MEDVTCNPFFTEFQDTLFFQMHRIHRVMFLVANKMIQEERMSVKMEQFPVFMSIFINAGISQQEIANNLQRDKSSVTRTVTALLKKGLIEVRQDSKDKRKKLLHTTEAGSRVGIKIKDIIRKVEQDIFSAFDSGDIKETIQSVKRTADKLEHMKK